MNPTDTAPDVPVPGAGQVPDQIQDQTPDPDPAPVGRDPSSRREMAAAVAGCLLGAALVLFSGGATWASGSVVAGTIGDVVAPLDVTFTGSDLAPGASALGLAGLAAVVAVVATRRTGRLLTGFLLVAVGAGVVFLAGRALADPWAAVAASSAISDVTPDGVALAGDLDRSAAGWVAALGGLVLAASGLLVIARAGRWPAMSARYERRKPAPADAWEAIEQGEDPT